MYYGLLREPDVTAFVENMEDEEEEPSALNTSSSGKNLKKETLNIRFELL